MANSGAKVHMERVLAAAQIFGKNLSLFGNMQKPFCFWAKYISN